MTALGFLAFAASATAQSALFPLDHFWTHALDAPFAAPPAADGSRLFVPLQTGHITAIDTATDTAVWSVELATADMPIAADGRLVVVAAGAIHGLDAASGTVAWRLPAGDLAAPLLYRSGWLVVALADGAVQAVRASDGSVVWARVLAAPATAAPAIDGNLLVVPLTNGSLAALDLPTGKPLWTRPLGATASGVTISGDRIFAGTEDGHFWSLKARNGDQDWRWRVGARLIGAPAADGDRVYAVAADNVVRGFSRRSGNQRWSLPLTTRALAGPVLVDGVLVVTTAEVGKPGLTYVQADTGKSGGKTPPIPAVMETMRVQFPALMTSGATPRVFIATATPGGDWALHGYRQTFLTPSGTGPLAFGKRYEVIYRLPFAIGVRAFGTAVNIFTKEPAEPKVPRVPQVP